MARALLPERIELDGVVELLRCRNVSQGWSPAEILVECSPLNWHLPSELQHLRNAWEQRNPNQRSDPKVALRGIQLNQDHTLTCRLQATTWRDVRPLHEAASLADDALVRATASGYEMLLPNIGVVHVVASTLDGWILAFRRSAMSHYHPGDWSTTYEEGLAPEDMVGGAVFQQAARRGLAEEIAPDLKTMPLESFKVMSIVMERPLGNPAVVVMVELPISRSELPIKRPSDELDAESVVSIPIDQLYISKILSTPNFALARFEGRWHPTARYRLLIAMAHYFGEDVAATALSRIAKA